MTLVQALVQLVVQLVAVLLLLVQAQLVLVLELELVLRRRREDLRSRPSTRRCSSAADAATAQRQEVHRRVVRRRRRRRRPRPAHENSASRHRPPSLLQPALFKKIFYFTARATCRRSMAADGDSEAPIASVFLTPPAWSKRYPSEYFTCDVVGYTQDVGDGCTRYKVEVSCSAEESGKTRWLRYSEFRAVAAAAKCSVAFPPKTWAANPTGREFLESRRTALQRWLLSVLETTEEPPQALREMLMLDQFRRAPDAK